MTPLPAGAKGGAKGGGNERAKAGAIAARLPPLVLAAERVAATVAAGAHGRRRPGHGDAFWQHRPFRPGDARARIDWRQSARADRVLVRDAEQEAAQTCWLWLSPAPSMDWRSAPALPAKTERAALLLLALAALLLRGGERVRLAGCDRAFHGRAALPALAEALAGADDAWPAPPANAHLVLFGDFLEPLPELGARFAARSAPHRAGHAVQVLDPAEAALPYAGRVRFEPGAGAGGAPVLVPRAEAVRDAYAAAMAAQQAGLATICRAHGLGFAVHRTDQPPEACLLALWLALTA